MALTKSEKKDIAYRLRSQKAADAISAPAAESIAIAADEDSDLEAGDLQEVIVALSARIKVLEEA